MTRPRTAGDLLSQRPHTDLDGDDESDQLSDPEYNAGLLPERGEYDEPDDEGDDDNDELPTLAEIPDEQEQRERSEAPEEVREQFNDLMEDAEEGDFKLTDYQRYWRRLQGIVLHHVNKDWRLAGPTRDAAAHVGTVVQSGQKVGSHLTQLYAQRHLGIDFTPFDPGPGIIERPGTNKLMVYSRPIRERSLGAQLSRLETLANTDLQLAKVRTLYSAFNEDQTVNRAPIKTWRRVTTSENPCALCEIAADQVYFSDDLMAIHDNCMCDIELADESDLDEHKARYHHIGFVQTLLDIGEQKKDIQTLADEDAPAEDYHNLTKIEQHGELGPVITWAGQKFTGPGELPNPMPVRPTPTVSGPGRGHEARLAENRARVAQYRAQQFGPGGRAEPRYHPEHGKGSSYVPTSYGLPPITKTVGPKPPKPRPIEMGHVIATIGPGGRVSIETAGKVAEKAGIDWGTASLDDMLDYMARKHSGAVPRGSWRLSLWTSTKYNRVAKRRTLQAIDEMLTKYPDVKFDGGFKIAKLENGVVAETSYRPRLNGRTTFMTFNTDIMERTPDELTQAFRAAEDAGLYFSGASEDPYRAMVYHEYGHVLDVRGTNQAREQASRLMIAEFMKSGRPMTKEDLSEWMAEKDRLSGYSMQDFVVPGRISPLTGKPGSLALSPGESIAQAFDDVERRGERASDVSRALHAEVVERAKIPYPTTPLTPGYSRAALQETAVERLKKMTQPKIPWTDADFAKEDNFNKRKDETVILSDEDRSLAKQLATDIYRKAKGVEDAITAAAESSVGHNGGYMSGLDFRLKTGPSLYRKIQAEAIEYAQGKPVTENDLRTAAADIKDAVRYTGVVPEEGYWAKGDDIRKSLESLGAKNIKDPVGIPLNGYRGRNMSFEYKGVAFEMQVHTELGVAIKDEAHHIYNESRVLKEAIKNRGEDPNKDPAYLKMFNDMQAKWDTMPMLKGTPVVQTEKDAKSGDPNKVLYIAKDTKYRGPTVPGGEAELGSLEMLGRERVPSTRFGLTWTPDSPEAKIVAPARTMDKDVWATLPVQMLPHGTKILANEGTLKKKSIDKVVGGTEPFREGYHIELFQDKNGLHVVDGHTRVAMYYALNKDMPVKILTQDDINRWANEPVHEALKAPLTGLSADDKGWGSVARRLPGGETITPVFKEGKGGKKTLDLEGTWATVSDETLKENWRKALRDAAPWAQKAGVDWYPGVNRLANKLTDKYGKQFEKRWGIKLTPDLTAAFFAAYSENNGWDGNLVGVRRLLDGTGNEYLGVLKDFKYSEASNYRGIKAGKYGTKYVIPASTPSPERIAKARAKIEENYAKKGKVAPKDATGLSEFQIPGETGWYRLYDFHVNKALRAAQNPRGGIADLRENDATAPKPADFGANIAGDYDKATADRWVARIILHSDDGVFSESMRGYSKTTGGVPDRIGYKRMSKALQDVSKEPEFAHLNAAAVQAIPWVHVVGPLGSIGEIDDLSSYASVKAETLRKAAEFGDVE
jgi:hypothetical protein